jgi:hypothetical protein
MAYLVAAIDLMIWRKAAPAACRVMAFGMD